MLHFISRIYFRQYLKGKKHKFDFKVLPFCLEGGYTYHMEIQCGTENFSDLSVVNKIIFELIEDLLNVGRTLYTYNLYTNVGLASQLLWRSIEKKREKTEEKENQNAKEIGERKIKNGGILAQEKIIQWLSNIEITDIYYFWAQKVVL